MPVDKFGRMPQYITESGASLASINNNFLRRDSTNVLLTDGTTQPTRDISWNNKKITNLAEPTNLQDACTA